MTQTAVEWLVLEIQKLKIQITHESKLKLMTAIEQAKEMQKQQILDAFDDGWDSGHDDAHGNGAFFEDKEDYWNNTFNK